VPVAALPLSAAAPATLAEAYTAVRAASLALIDGLTPEDAALQSMPDASPTKWHLAHSSWFFEQFVLAEDPAYRPVHAGWPFLFNSYYQSVGPMHARPRRGLLSRPGLAEVLDYRAEVDRRLLRRLEQPITAELHARITLGLHHEQQHQELILTDLLHLFFCNPLEPVYRPAPPATTAAAVPLRFIDRPAGIVEIGHRGDSFAFDCETPRHRVLLAPHALANRPVNNAEYRAFIADGGYRQPGLWLSEGWNRVQQDGLSRPLYWAEDLASHYSLHGRQALDPRAPVCHLSYFEADAFARWAGARLPTEAEWECAAAAQAPRGHFADGGHFCPRAPQPGDGLLQLYGDVWEWTASAYQAYPGYRPLAGALAEYNGKFMCGQFVLRGGSCATPAGHVRASYRNFFPPPDRWQFSGLRLAQDR
jgi:ergothioneine biosynthesis protein EgtB